jgi:bacillithiol system protein YtxJ
MKELSGPADLDAALAAPGPAVLYKHSTRCDLCDSAIAEVEAFARGRPDVDVYYLDLLAHRDVSNSIAARLGVRHESPQAIVLRAGKAVAVLNHEAVRADALERASAQPSRQA